MVSPFRNWSLIAIAVPYVADLLEPVLCKYVS